MVIGAAGPLSVDPILLITGQRSRERLVLGNIDRLTGYAQVQRGQWRAVDERNFSARSSGSKPMTA